MAKYHQNQNFRVYEIVKRSLSTVGKFRDFCIIQILREIKFEDFQSAKSAILPHLEALNFDYYNVLHFLKAEMCQIS